MNLWRNIKEMFAARDLLLAIAERDVRSKYKQAFMGIAWVVLQPLAWMMMFTLVFSKLTMIPSDGIPYPLFSFTALLYWGFFSGGIMAACDSIVGNAALITKIRMATEVFPLSAIVSRVVDLVISSIILFVMILIYKVSISVQMLWVIPLLIIQLLLMMGISLILSTIAVFYRDISFGIGLLMQMWMFASPVAYPISIVPERYRELYMLNPMASILDGYRKVILHGTLPDLKSLLWIFLASIAILILSYSFLKFMEPKFADLV